MRSGHVATSQTAGTTRRVCLLLAAAALAGCVAVQASAQTAEFTAAPTVFPATGNNFVTTQTVAVQVNSPTAISSLVIPIGFVSSPDFVLISQTGCVIDGSTINAAGTVCTATVSFRPLAAGLRTATLVITNVAGRSTAFGISGTGYYSQVSITPSSSRVIIGQGPTVPAFTGDGNTATLAATNSPEGIAADSFGNIFFADSGNNVVRMLDAFGNVTTIAGGGTLAGAAADGGPATSAALLSPSWLAVDAAGNLYISESGRNVIRRVKLTTDGTISTYAGTYSTGSIGEGKPNEIALNNPQGIVLDPAGNLYIADMGGERIRMVNPTDTMVTVIAGTGVAGFNDTPAAALSTQFRNPTALTLDAAGHLYISDTGNHVVRELVGGSVQLVAGTGLSGHAGDGGDAGSATLTSPSGLYVSPAGDLYIVDSGSGSVRKVEASTNNIQTVMGTAKDAGGYTAGVSVSTSTRMNLPTGLALDARQNLYVADTGNNVIRIIPGSPGEIAFAAQTVGNTSSPVSVQIANTGNAPLTFANLAPANGTTSSNFALNDTGTGNCAGTITSGAHCSFSVAFSPQASGFIAGEIDAFDNAGPNPNNTYTHPIYLSGGVMSALAISPGTLAPPVVNVAYTGTITAAGGFGTIAVQTAGTLPPGITANISGSVITLSGTATATGSFTYTVYASDQLGSTTMQTYTLTVVPMLVNLTINESIATADTFTDVTGLMLNINEAIGVSDSQTQLIGLTLNINESVTSTDTQTDLIGLSSPINEAVSVSDAIQLSAGVPLALSRAAGALPAGTVNTTYAAQTVSVVGGVGAIQLTVSGYIPGMNLSVANGTLTISGTPTTASGYSFTLTATDGLGESVSAVYTLAINTNSQSITAPGIPDHTYGDASFAVSATASSGLPVTIRVSGPATLTNGVLDMTGAGTVSVTFTQAGNADYTTARPVIRSFTVAPASATIIALNASRAFATANPTFTYTASGLVHGDTVATLGGVPSLSSTAVLNSPAGGYSITAAQGTLPSTNYVFAYTPGTLTVTGHVAQTITFLQPPNIPVSFGSITLSAHSTSGLSVVYNVSGPATISKNKLTFTGAGAVTVTASQPGNATFDPAPSISRTFTVTP